MFWFRRLVPILLALSFLAPPALAAELRGQVVAIQDGDTLTLLTPEKQQVRVRLAEIDTPESRQPYGNRAQQELSSLAFRKDVRVVVQNTDRYGRKVGRIYAGPVDVNAEMIRRGAAWVYRQYSRDPALPPLEAEARTAHRGLWRLPEAERTPPWEWRAAARQGGQRAGSPKPGAALERSSAASSPATGFICGTKRYCREMTSCAEARFHFSQCGIPQLDGNRDGTPCELLCR